MPDWNWIDWPLVAGLGLFAAGVMVGLGMARGARAARLRAEELERELFETRATLERQRERIGAHFEQTAELFGDLTRQHVALYAHLAESAQELCPERVPALSQSLELPKLGAPVAGKEAGEEPAKGDAAAIAEAPAAEDEPAAAAPPAEEEPAAEDQPAAQASFTAAAEAPAPASVAPAANA